jgi:hypothetical protein
LKTTFQFARPALKNLRQTHPQRRPIEPRCPVHHYAKHLLVRIRRTRTPTRPRIAHAALRIQIVHLEHPAKRLDWHVFVTTENDRRSHFATITRQAHDRSHPNRLESPRTRACAARKRIAYTALIHRATPSWRVVHLKRPTKIARRRQTRRRTKPQLRCRSHRYARTITLYRKHQLRRRTRTRTTTRQYIRRAAPRTLSRIRFVRSKKVFAPRRILNQRTVARIYTFPTRA